MAQTNSRQAFAFIALETTGRADRNGQSEVVLPCRLVAWLALRSLASVALCAASNQAEAVHEAVNLSTRGHLYFGKQGTSLLWFNQKSSARDILTFRCYNAVMSFWQDALRCTMTVLTKRTTVYLDHDLHQALRLKAAVTDSSMSELINGMIRACLAEDAEDLQAFRERAGEPVISYESLLQELQAHGKL
jgi:hypothetical protein